MRRCVMIHRTRRRAARVSIAALFGTHRPLVCLLLALAAGAGMLGCGETEPRETPVVEAEPEPAPDPEQFWTAWTDTVRRGDTLWDILHRHNVYVAEMNRVLRAVERDGPFSWRSLRPGHRFRGFHDELGALRRVLYTRSAEEVYRLDVTPDTVTVAQVEVARDVYWRRLRAVVNSTVDGALRRVGGDAQLLHQLAQTLSWDVDFFTDPRRGDTLDVLVEEIYVDGEFIRFGDILRVIYSGDQVRTEGTQFKPAGWAAREFFDSEGRNLRKSFLKSPLNYRRISSRFTHRRMHPILKVYRPHLGVDYAAPAGTPVVAVGDGEVVRAGWNGGFGRYVKIRHNASVSTTYGHLRAIARGVRRGARVQQNQVIGYVGSTGLSTGPHLDFRVVRNGQYIDPLRMKNPPAEPIPEQELPQFLAQRDRLAEAMAALEPGARCRVVPGSVPPQESLAALRDAAGEAPPP
ncbi:MAG: peptidoglycan DD-metalloendopeptidase family protein [Candidatus Eisenbacteria bacterium]|nr:peptidoglycan DD-metalloendopeptidase family protein [Candidatus Eisenbacteria bacterium]